MTNAAPPLAALAAVWRFADGFAAKAVAGFSAADWDARVADASSARWILGHVAWARRSASRLLGLLDTHAPWEPLFKRGSAPDAATGPGGDELLAEFRALGAPLIARIAELDHAAVSARTPTTFPDGSDRLGGALHFLHFHESYHVGQLGLIRRLLGKPRVA